MADWQVGLLIFPLAVIVIIVIGLRWRRERNWRTYFKNTKRDDD